MNMTDRKHLPAAINQKVAVHVEQRGSLVVRGLVAIEESKRLAVTKANNALYRHARDAYNRITDDGNKHGFGDIWSTGELAELNAAFEAFQRLADKQYGKAYFPLSRFYTGYQSIPENKELARHYARLTFEWCYANQLQNDPEIWNDLCTSSFGHCLGDNHFGVAWKLGAPPYLTAIRFLGLHFLTR